MTYNFKVSKFIRFYQWGIEGRYFSIYVFYQASFNNKITFEANIYINNCS